MTSTRPTILILEDEVSLQKAIAAKLRLSGFNVLTARASEEALDLVGKTDRIDGFWIDHYLLGRDTGLNFINRLKEEGKLQDVKFFVVSNSVSQDKSSAYLEAGAQKYYTKANFRLDEIVADIKQSLPV